MMSTKFSGRWDDSLEKDADGRFFIDQSMALFQPLVDYLRAVASQTPLARFPASPVFSDPNLQQDFYRMVEYYGITLGVFPIGMYKLDSNLNQELVSSYPDYEVTSDETATFWLVPQGNGHQRYINSFEVTLGAHTIAQIGWTGWTSRNTVLTQVAGGYQGAGYGNFTMAFDCTRLGMIVNQQYTSIPNTSVQNGTVIRCESKGESWSFDGDLKVLTVASPPENAVQVSKPNVSTPVPCLTVKGSFRISYIELDF